FHPLDGARYLEAHGWPSRLCGLVAYHSGSHFVAGDLGLRDELYHFFHERGPLHDALTFADQTVGPTGEPVTFDERVGDMPRRPGPDRPTRALPGAREPYLRAAVDRVERRLADLDDTPGRHRRD